VGITYHTVKNFGSKKFGEKSYRKTLAKKLQQILTCNANRQSSINSKTKQFKTLMNIIKPTPYFPGFGLCYALVGCLMMAGDVDGEVHCRNHDLYI